MASAIVSGAKMYTSAVKIYPYMNSKFAQALGDNQKFKFSAFGEATMVREIVGVSAGSYDGSGWNATDDTGSGWTPHTAEFDREISFAVDAVEEMNSILNGMELTGLLKAKASWKKLGPEIDAVSCATISSAVPVGNSKLNTADGYKTDVDNIIPTIIAVRQQIFDLGYAGDIALMMDSATYGVLTNAFVKGFGLASGAMLTTVSANIAPTEKDYFEDTLEFKGTITRFMDNVYIYVVPSTSMINKVIMLDKKTTGQEAGGFAPDSTTAGFHNVNMLFVPKEAAALSVRHLVGNMTVPQRFADQSGFDIANELEGLNNMYDGVTGVQNIGIDQNGDQFRYLNRIKYGPTTFETQAHLLFEIHGADTVAG